MWRGCAPNLLFPLHIKPAQRPLQPPLEAEAVVTLATLSASSPPPPAPGPTPPVSPVSAAVLLDWSQLVSGPPAPAITYTVFSFLRALSSGWQCHGVWSMFGAGMAGSTAAVGKITRAQFYHFASMTKVPVKQSPVSDSSELRKGMSG